MTDIKNEEAGEKKSLNFIEQAVEKDLWKSADTLPART